MNNQTNQDFSFQDSGYNPFDPFGIGSDSATAPVATTSQSTGDNSTTGSAQSSQSSQDGASQATQSSQTSSPLPSDQSTSDDGLTVKNLNPEEDKEDKTPANFQIGSNLRDIKIPLKPHSLNFDERKFLHLLAGSISLGIDEKKKILNSIPTLRQAQVDQLIEIFEDEKKKFAELPQKHVSELIKLDQKHNLEWTSIEDEYLLEQKKREEDAKVDEIRKKLGL